MSNIIFSNGVALIQHEKCYTNHPVEAMHAQFMHMSIGYE